MYSELDIYRQYDRVAPAVAAARALPPTTTRAEYLELCRSAGCWRGQVLVRLLGDAVPPALADLPEEPTPDADDVTKELTLMWMLILHARKAQMLDLSTRGIQATPIGYDPMKPYLKLSIVDNKDWPEKNKELFDAVYDRVYLIEFEKHNSICFYMELSFECYVRYKSMPDTWLLAYGKDLQDLTDYILDRVVEYCTVEESEIVYQRYSESKEPIPSFPEVLLIEVLGNKQNAESFLASIIRLENSTWLFWYNAMLKDNAVWKQVDFDKVVSEYRGKRFERCFVEQLERVFDAELYSSVTLD